MDINLYERFIALKNQGAKADAKAALAAFIASFQTLEEKRGWVFSFLERGEYGHKIRHELYEALVYPVLLDGYLKQDANSVVWLAKTVDNLYAVKPTHPLLQHQTSFTLFKVAYALKPDESIRAELLQTLLHWFGFSQHEWPAGILYGMDGADLEQSKEILQEVDYARQLDHEGQHAPYLADFETKVKQYMARLQDTH